MKTAKRVLVVLAVVALLVAAFGISTFAAEGETTVTWTAANAGYSNGATVATVKPDSVVTFECAKGTNTSNPPKYYTSGTNLRLYAGNTMKISVADGYEIKSVVLTASSGYAASASANYYSGDVTASTSGTATTITPSRSGVTSFTLTNAGSSQIRLTKVAVTYAKVAQADADATAEEKIATEKQALGTSLSIEKAGVEELAIVGSTYDDVAISWASDNALAVVDNAAGTVTYTLPEAGADDVKVNLTATISCDGKSETKSFEVTLVAPPAAIEGAWSLVTDASTLNVGDKIVIVAKDYNYAMSTVQGGNNRAQVAITKGDGVVNFDETVQVIILEAGSTEGTFALKTEEGYLFAASSSSNYMRSQEKIDVNASWTITVSGGTASIVATGSSNRNVMQYNQTSSLFSCYGSATQKALTIYKLDTGSMSDEDKIESVMGGVSIPDVISVAGTQITLPSGNDSVSVNWVLSANDYASIVDGKLVVNTLPAGSEVVTLTATATCGSATVTKTYAITLKTITQAEIVDMAFALSSGATLENGPYTLTGVISKIVTAYDSGYKNVTVNITVYNTAGVAKTIQCFRLSGVGADAIKVGDEITVTGTIKNYNGTIEFDAGCTLDKYPNPVAVVGASLNIKDNIDVYYYVSVNAGFKSASASFTFNGQTTTVSSYKKLEDGRLMFVFEGINPAEMADEISVTFSVKYTTNTYTASHSGMSVKKYYQMAQNYEGTKNDTALMTLLSDLLVYGAAAQAYVGDTDALVTEGLELTPSTNAIPESVFASTGDAFKSVALELGSDVTFIICVELEGGDVVTVNFNGITTTYAQENLVADENGVYTIKVAGVFATAYAEVLTAEVNGNTLTYSVNSYINEKANDENANLAALVAALNNYGASAAAYKNA